MTKQNRKALRERLIRLQQNMCFFCYRQMHPVEADTALAATLFAFDDRYAPWRGSFNHQIRHAAVCRECAQIISDRRTLGMPIDELHRRSGRGDGAEAVYQLTGQP